MAQSLENFSDFKSIISDPKLFARAMLGSSRPGSTYEQWQVNRQFIANLIPGSGSILDIGCGNGFFLKSLQEWSGKKLEPYGIDINPDFIADVPLFFPAQVDNFMVVDVKNIDQLYELGLPHKFDFIFWNFLGIWQIKDVEFQILLNKILSLAKQRVFIGFYGTNQYAFNSEEWRQERQRLINKRDEFALAGFKFDGFQLNPAEYNETVGWFNI